VEELNKYVGFDIAEKDGWKICGSCKHDFSRKVFTLGEPTLEVWNSVIFFF